MELRLKYGTREQTSPIPPLRSIKELRTGGIAPLAPVARLLADSLEKPVGAYPFKHVFRRAKNLLIVLPGNFFPQILSDIAAEIVKRLQCTGVDSEEIRFLLAAGAYASPVSQAVIAELAQKTGLAPDRFFIHNGNDHSKLDYLGDAGQGFPLHGNKLLLEADELILLGIVQPHLLWGMTGGPELLFPGCMSEETLSRACNVFCRPDIYTPEQAGYPLAEHGKMLLRALPATFAVNVVIDETGRVVAVVSGKPSQAHLAASAWLDQIRTKAQSPPGALTVASCGGAPYDDGLEGLCLGLSNALTMTRSEGELILLARCARASRRAYPRRMQTFLGKYLRNIIAHAGRKHIFLVSELAEELSDMAGITPCEDLAEAMQKIRRGYKARDITWVIGNACLIRKTGPDGTELSSPPETGQEGQGGI